MERPFLYSLLHSPFFVWTSTINGVNRRWLDSDQFEISFFGLGCIYVYSSRTLMCSDLEYNIQHTNPLRFVRGHCVHNYASDYVQREVARVGRNRAER